MFNIVFQIRNTSKYVNSKRTQHFIYFGITLPKKTVKKISNEPFAFRVKTGKYEVEIRGEREEVLKTIKELSTLMADIHKAFETPKPKTTATLTVKTVAKKEETSTQKYPKIVTTEDCNEAILNILATDWGKWRPRTIRELKEALKANKMQYPGRTLAGVLLGLTNKGKIRRWKTDTGCVYILAEKEVLT